MHKRRFRPKWVIPIVTLVAQVLWGQTGTLRENLGIYGGTILDYAYDSVHGKMFAAVEGPLSLFVSSDSGQTWEQAFPDDSLGWMDGSQMRGWGGRGTQISTHDGMTAVMTVEQGGVLSACVLSTDGENWRTLFDNVLIGRIKDSLHTVLQKDFGNMGMVSYVHIYKGTIFAAWSNTVLVSTDTAKTWHVMPFPDSAAFGLPDNERRKIKQVIPIDETGGAYYVVACDAGDEQTRGLFVTNDGKTFDLVAIRDTAPIAFVNPPPGSTEPPPEEVDTSKGIDSGRVVFAIQSVWVNMRAPDTLFLHEFGEPSNGGEHAIHRSFDGGASWQRVVHNSQGPNLEEMVVFQDNSLPGPDNIRLIGGYLYSDDLGESWNEAFDRGELKTPQSISGYIDNSTYYLGYRGDGPYLSKDGIGGPYERVFDGLASVTVRQVAQRADDMERVFLATRSGIGFTTVFTDSTIDNDDKWKKPYGEFPLQPSAETNFHSVAISPYDENLVLAGAGNGIFRTTNGGKSESDWSMVPYDQVIGLDAHGVKGSGGSVQNFAFYSTDSVFAAISGQRQAVGGLALSTDGGATWQVKTGFPVGACRVVTVGQNTSSGAKVIYVGMGLGGESEGMLYRSNDGGQTWDSMPGPDATNNDRTKLPVRDIAVRNGSTDTIYVTASDNLAFAVCYSFNGGDSLIPVESHMKHGMEVYSIAINKNNPDSVFLAARNKILLLDFTKMQDDTLKPVEDSLKPPEDSLKMPPPPGNYWPRLTDYFHGLPGEIIYDLHYDDLVMTSSVGFFGIQGQAAPHIPPSTSHRALLHSKRGVHWSLTTLGVCRAVYFSLPKQSKISITIHDLLGRYVACIAEGEFRAGAYTIPISQTKISKGIYTIRLMINNRSRYKKFTIVH